jgi:hypothetical protein
MRALSNTTISVVAVALPGMGLGAVSIRQRAPHVRFLRVGGRMSDATTSERGHQHPLSNALSYGSRVGRLQVHRRGGMIIRLTVGLGVEDVGGQATNGRPSRQRLVSSHANRFRITCLRRSTYHSTPPTPAWRPQSECESTVPDLVISLQTRCCCQSAVAHVSHLHSRL